jgi:hypothetical protein
VDDGRARGEGGEGGLLQCTTRLCAGCDMRGRIGNTASKQASKAGYLSSAGGDGLEPGLGC